MNVESGSVKLVGSAFRDQRYLCSRRTALVCIWTGGRHTKFIERFRCCAKNRKKCVRSRIGKRRTYVVCLFNVQAAGSSLLLVVIIDAVQHYVGLVRTAAVGISFACDTWLQTQKTVYLTRIRRQLLYLDRLKTITDRRILRVDHRIDRIRLDRDNFANGA